MVIRRKRAKPEEPRPTCPECGKVVRPRGAVPFGRARDLARRVLEGIYCSSDCLLDAYKRGYPMDRAVRND